MTIGRRLIVLVAVPLMALLAFGIFARLRLAEIEDRSRFAAEGQLGSVAALGSIVGSFAELRVSVRNSLLAADDGERAAARAVFDENDRTLAQSSRPTLALACPRLDEQGAVLDPGRTDRLAAAAAQAMVQVRLADRRRLESAQRPGAGQGEGLVPAGVVRDHQLQVRQRLAEGRADGLVDERGRVVGGEDDGDQRPGVHRAPGSPAGAPRLPVGIAGWTLGRPSGSDDRAMGNGVRGGDFAQIIGRLCSLA